MKVIVGDSGGLYVQVMIDFWLGERQQSKAVMPSSV
jgi:hypothetical protein